MKLITDIQPHIRAAHKYTYKGGREEQRRRGYSYAFHLFSEGQGYMHVEDQRYEVESGTLIFVRPGEAHAFELREGEMMDACNIYCDLWSKPIEDQPAFAFGWDHYEVKWLTDQPSCEILEAMPTCMSLRSFPHLIELLNLTLLTFNRAGKHNIQAASACIYAWILQWVDSTAKDQIQDYRIARILKEMDRYPERRWSHNYWCDQTGLEKSQFYRLFKQETSLSPKAYILRIRMQKAAVLLMESRQSITEIALSLGYDSVHYFTNQFTSMYQVSPSAYRLGQKGTDSLRLY